MILNLSAKQLSSSNLDMAGNIRHFGCSHILNVTLFLRTKLRTILTVFRALIEENKVKVIYQNLAVFDDTKLEHQSVGV